MFIALDWTQHANTLEHKKNYTYNDVENSNPFQIQAGIYQQLTRTSIPC